ncbi:MAG: hypothetical protein Kow0022_12020 [Phycisphaerales bacterium]
MLIPTAVVLCVAASIVVTAYLLGAAWLGHVLLGLPLGVWVLAAVYVAWRRGWFELLETSIPGFSGRRWFSVSPVAQRRLAPLMRWLVACRAVLSDLAIAAWNLEPRTPADLRACILRALDNRPELAAPLQIALAAPPEIAAHLARFETAVPVCWHHFADSSAIRTHRFELLFQHDGFQGGTATAPETGGQSATWFDWSVPRPLSFASVFPHHVDPAQVTIALLPSEESDDPLVTALLVAAAAQARCPARLSLADRLAGRIPLDGDENPSTIDPGAFRVRAMRRIEQILAGRDPDDATVVERTAASVVSAWLVTPGARVPMAERRSMLERVARFQRTRAETWLRLAAVRFANYDDDGAIDALLEADPLVRAASDQIVLDQSAFVLSELTHGGSGPLTLGRVAAGICLLAAQHPYERLEYLRDDLIEELRYAGWLVGRDQDTLVLHRIIRELTRIRRAEARGLPMPHGHGPVSREAA